MCSTVLISKYLDHQNLRQCISMCKIQTLPVTFVDFLQLIYELAREFSNSVATVEKYVSFCMPYKVLGSQP